MPLQQKAPAALSDQLDLVPLVIMAAQSARQEEVGERADIRALAAFRIYNARRVLDELDYAFSRSVATSSVVDAYCARLTEEISAVRELLLRDASFGLP